MVVGGIGGGLLPAPLVRADGVAVRADDLAPGDLREDQVTPAAVQLRDVGDLHDTRRVVPLHRGRVEGDGAVSAWSSLLQ